MAESSSAPLYLAPHEASHAARLAAVAGRLAHTLERTVEDAPGCCPSCGSEDWARDGFAVRRHGAAPRVFRCRGCGKKRVAHADGPFRHPVFPPSVMALAVWLSTEGWPHARIAAAIGIHDADGALRQPNRQTVGRWVRRLGPVVAAWMVPDDAPDDADLTAGGDDAPDAVPGVPIAVLRAHTPGTPMDAADVLRADGAGPRASATAPEPARGPAAAGGPGARHPAAGAPHGSAAGPGGAAGSLEARPASAAAPEVAAGSPAAALPPSAAAPTPDAGAAWAAPLPELADRAAGGAGDVLFGRDEALAGVLAALEPGAVGRGALVIGPDGIGKSRLLGAVADHLRAAGRTVLPGPLSRALPAVVEHLGEQHPLVRQHGDVIRRLTGRSGDLPGPARPRDGILHDRDAVLQLLDVGQAGDTVLLVDDVEHTDGPTFAVIEALVEGPSPGPRVMLAVRDAGEVERDGAVQRWVGSGRLHARVLAPLGAADVRAWLQGALGREPWTRELAARIHRVTEGNPRFVEEVVRGLFEAGGVTRSEDGRWRLRPDVLVPIPQAIVEASLARVRALEPTAARALALLAVARRPVPADAVTRMAGGARIELTARGLVGERFDSHGRAVAVAHEAVREAALCEVTPSERRTLAATLADALQTLEEQEPAELLAELLLGAGRPQAAVAWLDRAARRAVGRFDVDEALGWLEALNDVLASTPGLEVAEGLREGTLRELNRMLRFRGRREDQAVCLERLDLLARTSAEADALLEAAALRALYWFDGGQRDLARAIGESHLHRAREVGDGRAAARLLWILAMVELGDGNPREALRLSGEALAALADHADPEALELRVQNHINRGNALGQLGMVERAVDAFEESLVLCRQHRLLSSAIVSTMNLGICCALQARYGPALAYFDRARSQSRRLGWPEMGDFLEANQAEVERNLGLLEVAAERADRLFRGANAGRVDLPAMAARCTRAACYVGRGDTSAAARLLEEVPRAVGPLSARLGLGWAEVHRQEGRAAAAREALLGVLDGAASASEAGLATCRLAAHALDAGDTAEADVRSREAMERFRAGGAQEGVVEALFVRATVRLAQGDREEGLRTLARAAEELRHQAEELDAPVQSAFLALPVAMAVAAAAAEHLGQDVGLTPQAAPQGGAGQVAPLERVLRFARRLARAGGLAAVAELVLEEAMASTGAEGGVLALRESDRMVGVGSRGQSTAGLDPGTAGPARELLDAMLGERRLVASAPGPGGRHAQLCVPLSYGDRLIGACLLHATAGFAPVEPCMRFVLEALGDQAAIAVQHCIQVDEIERLRRRAEADLRRTRARLQEESTLRDQAERVAEAERRTARLRFRYDQIIQQSAAMGEVLQQVDRLVDRKITVLVTGESGTGKELVARALHSSGPRKDGPFVAINCGAIPANLIESELFGHVRGAFTGAVKDRRGHFELAHRGTLFLDEIGEISPDVQVRLLRVLETGEVTPVGTSRRVRVDVRIVAATNRDLRREAAEGRFREDLLYRINAVSLRLPPLRERPEDLDLLVDHFARQVAEERGEAPMRFGPVIRERLGRHHWPGNVRELRNVVAYATLFAEQGEVPPDLALPFQA